VCWFRRRRKVDPVAVVEVTGTGTTLTVPSNVPDGSALYLWTVEPASGGGVAPSGMTFWDSWSYTFPTVNVVYYQYEPFTHDGRSSYTFAAASTKFHGVFVTNAADNDGHDLVVYGDDRRGIYAGWVYAFDGGWVKRGGDTGADVETMRWDFFGDPVETITGRWLLLAGWSAADVSGDTVLLGVDVVSASGNVEQIAGDPEGDYAVTYTRSWPGNGSGSIYQWVAQAWVVNVSGVVERRVRQRQIDNLRHRQTESRQRTTRGRSYI